MLYFLYNHTCERLCHFEIPTSISLHLRMRAQIPNNALSIHRLSPERFRHLSLLHPIHERLQHRSSQQAKAAVHCMWWLHEVVTSTHEPDWAICNAKAAGSAMQDWTNLQCKTGGLHWSRRRAIAAVRRRGWTHVNCVQQHLLSTSFQKHTRSDIR